MVNNDRIRCPIPTRELQRRWDLIRKAMKDQEIDLLIMQNDNQYLGGYVRYFIDIPSEQAYPVTVVFPQNEEMTVISSGGGSLPPLPPDYAARGIKHKIALPYFRTLNYTHNLDAGAVVKTIRNLNAKKVGFVGIGMISTAFSQYVKDSLPGLEFVNATDLVDEVKAVKSEDEIAFIRKSVAIHDIAVEAMSTIFRPGKYEYQIRSELQKILVDLGSEEQLIMLGSAPFGQGTPQLQSFYQNRKIQDGDQIMLMIEANGPGGYYCEIGRSWSLKEPPKELLDAWDIALEGQKLVAGMLKPGASPAEILQSYNDFLASKGYPPEGRLFAHGQGYDLVERPAFLPGETMRLKAGMFVANHPTIFNDKAYGFCCDNYFISETGAELAQKTPQKVFVLE